MHLGHYRVRSAHRLYQNGAPVLRADWAVTCVDGVVLFISLAQGDGGVFVVCANQTASIPVNTAGEQCIYIL